MNTLQVSRTHSLQYWYQEWGSNPRGHMSFLGVRWKSPVSPLGCPGLCPLSLSVPILPLIVIYCPVLSPCCPLLTLDCLFDIDIVLNCPLYSHIALDCPIYL